MFVFRPLLVSIVAVGVLLARSCSEEEEATPVVPVVDSGTALNTVADAGSSADVGADAGEADAGVPLDAGTVDAPGADGGAGDAGAVVAGTSKKGKKK